MHEVFMQRCIELAKKGKGKTSPNPMVGSVIVYENKIIGESWHKRYGDFHAEINAINSVKDKSLLSKSTIYINLEPCSHFGKNPPCCDFIIAKKIPNVVIGIMDINPIVYGRGVKKLKENNVNIITNILKEECYNLNKRFFTFHEKKRPYIILKWAETKDGFIDKIRNVDNIKDATSTEISDIYNRQLSHKLRAEEGAILVGKNTVLNDNPELTTRLYFGKNPIRILIDEHLEISKDYKVLNSKSKTIIFNNKKDITEGHLIYKKIDFSDKVEYQILDYLYKINILSLIIEGGLFTLQSFIKKKLYDEVIIYKSEKEFKTGIPSPKL